jgi:hypothetical protein
VANTPPFSFVLRTSLECRMTIACIPSLSRGGRAEARSRGASGDATAKARSSTRWPSTLHPTHRSHPSATADGTCYVPAGKGGDGVGTTVSPSPSCTCRKAARVRGHFAGSFVPSEFNRFAPIRRAFRRPLRALRTEPGALISLGACARADCSFCSSRTRQEGYAIRNLFLAIATSIVYRTPLRGVYF